MSWLTELLCKIWICYIDLQSALKLHAGIHYSILNATQAFTGRQMFTVYKPYSLGLALLTQMACCWHVREAASILHICYEVGESGRKYGEKKPSLNTQLSVPRPHTSSNPQRTLPEEWEMGMGRWEAVLGEIQGQSTHVSSIYHLPPPAQHITSLWI